MSAEKLNEDYLLQRLAETAIGQRNLSSEQSVQEAMGKAMLTVGREYLLESFSRFHDIRERNSFAWYLEQMNPEEKTVCDIAWGCGLVGSAVAVVFGGDYDVSFNQFRQVTPMPETWAAKNYAQIKSDFQQKYPDRFDPDKEFYRLNFLREKDPTLMNILRGSAVNLPIATLIHINSLSEFNPNILSFFWSFTTYYANAIDRTYQMMQLKLPDADLDFLAKLNLDF